MPCRSPYSPAVEFDDAANLLFTLRPQPHHRLAFAVEVGLHVGEAFDDSLDPMDRDTAVHQLISQVRKPKESFLAQWVSIATPHRSFLVDTLRQPLINSALD